MTPGIELDKDFVSSDFSHVELPTLPDIPGMITEDEARYLYWLASEVYSASGAIYELGTWLGRSSSCLAAGLARSHPDRVMLCFDHFEWAGGGGWSKKSGTSHEAKEDFLPDFLANTAAFSNQIEAVRTKVASISLPDEPVEIMAIDAPKRLKDISALMAELAGKVIAGKTILAWQDFMHGGSFEIPVALYQFRDVLTPVHVVERGCLVAFRVTGDWPAARATVDQLDFSDWSADMCRAVWDYWMPLVPENQKSLFRIGLPMLLQDLEHAEAALSETQELARWGDRRLVRKIASWEKTSLARRYAEIFAAFDTA